MFNKSTAKHLALIVSFSITISCSKEDINNKPVAGFNVVDEIDYFSLTSTSTDIDNDILTYEWISESELIDIENADSKDARFLIPEIDKSIEIQVKHIVCDNSLCDSITLNVQLPISTNHRKWGLGCTLEKEKSNDVDYEWYFDQINSGPLNYDNCGPTAVTMAIKWYDEGFLKTPEDARNNLGGDGWWYTDDILRYLNLYSVPNKTIEINSSDSLALEIDKGNIVIICLDMFYISLFKKDKWHIDKFYFTPYEEWGHFIVIKGYKKVDGIIFYEIYDPNSWGKKYEDFTLKGKNRYYKSNEINTATNNWWDYAIIISRENLKSANSIDIDKIEHKYGR